MPGVEPGSDSPVSTGRSRLERAPGFARSAGIMIPMVLLSRFTGFLRGTLLAYYFGQNRMTDAYVYAFMIPEVLWQLVAGGPLYAAFVPVITEYFARDDDEGAWKTFSIVFNFLGLLLLVILPLLGLFARPLLGVFAPDLSRPDPTHHGLPPGMWLVSLHGRQLPIYPIDLAVHLTRIIIPAQLCFFLGSLMMGCQHSLKRFVIPSLGPIVYNVGIIGGGIIGHTVQGVFGGASEGYGISGFAWGATIGAFLGSIVLQWYGLRGCHPRYFRSLDLHFPGVKKCGQLVLPVILGISLPQVDMIINGYYVSGLPAGRSILENANRLMQLPMGIFGQAIGMVILPMLAQFAAQKDWTKFKDQVSFGMRLALFMTVPAALLMIVLAEPLIHVVYEHGNFNHANTAAVIPSLVLYCIGVPAWSAQAVVARAFYARQDTRTPVIIGTSVTVVFFFLNGFLVHRVGMGVPGAALATTIAATLNTGVLFVILWRRIRGLDSSRFIRSGRRLILGSVLLAGVAWSVDHLLPYGFRHSLAGSVIDLVLAGGLGMAVYLAVQAAFRADELEPLRGFLQRLPRRFPKRLAQLFRRAR